VSRSRLQVLGLVAVALLAVASPGLARGDQEDDQRLAKQLLTALEKYNERQEVMVKHGRRAEIALTILQREQGLADLDATIRDMNTVIANFPQNRRQWIKDQEDYYRLKLAQDAQRNGLNRELTALRFQERQMYEEELQKAEARGGAVKPFNREAILHDLQRLDRETKQAFAALKEGVEAAARKQHTTPGEILQRLKIVTRPPGGVIAQQHPKPGELLQRAGNLAKRESSSPEALEKFLNDFCKVAGGNRWLDGAERASPGNNKRGSPR
jgi:hypothetical protein